MDVLTFSVGQWVMIWVGGWVISSLSTIHKDEMEGIFGFFMYLLISIFFAFIWTVGQFVNWLWRFLA